MLSHTTILYFICQPPWKKYIRHYLQKIINLILKDEDKHPSFPTYNNKEMKHNFNSRSLFNF